MGAAMAVATDMVQWLVDNHIQTYRRPPLAFVDQFRTLATRTAAWAANSPDPVLRDRATIKKAPYALCRPPPLPAREGGQASHKTEWQNARFSAYTDRDSPRLMVEMTKRACACFKPQRY